MPSYGPAEIIAELILADERFLRHVYVRSQFNFWFALTAARGDPKADIGIRECTSTLHRIGKRVSRVGFNGVHEVLKLNCEGVDFFRRHNEVVRNHEAMELVGISIGLGQIRNDRVSQLIVRVGPFLPAVSDEHALSLVNSPVGFHRDQIIDIREWYLLNWFRPAIKRSRLLSKQRQFTDGGRIDRQIARLPFLFECSKKEQFILLDGSSNGTAVVITMEFRIRPIAGGERFGVQAAVLEQAEQRPVQLVGAGFRDDIYHRSHGPAGLSRVAVRHHVEFLNALHREVLHDAADYVIFVVATVHRVVDTTSVRAVDGDISGSGLGWVEVLRRTHPRD